MSDSRAETRKSIDRRSSAKDVLFVALLALTATYGWTVYVPLIPQQLLANAEWLWALSIAHEKNLVFGRDIMFTYGPLGFTLGGYFPATFPMVVAMWTLLATVLWISLDAILRKHRAPRALAIASLAAFFLLSAGEHPSMPDARFFALPAILLAYHFWIDDSPTNRIKLMLTAALALAGLIKFTYLVVAIGVCAAISLDELQRCRKPLCIAMLALVYLIGWRASGQAFANLPLYISSSFDVAGGYGEAMSLRAETEVFDCLLYAFVALLLIALAWMASREQPVSRRSIHSLGLLFMLWMIFKAGYVRHDAHDVLATGLLPLATLVYALANYPKLRRSAWSIGWLACLVIAMCGSWRAYHRGAEESAGGTIDSLSRGCSELSDVVRIACGEPSSANKEFRRTCAESVAAAPLLRVDGPTDLLTMWSRRVVQNGLDYLPRPSIQSYSAYTPRLAEADAAFLRDPRGPRNVFYALELIDQRLPALDDGPAMLELLAKFDLVGRTPTHLFFRRSHAPRDVSMKPLAEQQGHYFNPVPIPPAGDKLIWAVIDVKPTKLGRLINMLYKVPPLSIVLNDSEHVAPAARFVPGCGRAGFIISPIIYNNDIVASLATPKTPTQSQQMIPTELRIADEVGQPPLLYYQPTFDVKFYEVSFISRSR